MQPNIPRDLAPTQVLEFECEQARTLVWLPLAVRFKLDECRLTLRLSQWQSLPVPARAQLLSAPLIPGDAGFARQAALAGASPDARDRRIRDGDGNATFARYVSRKIGELEHE